jgi:hypothetical protein
MHLRRRNQFVNKMIARAGATLALCLFVIPAFAGQTPPPKKAAAPTCPVCKMPLNAKKTATNTVAVQLKKGDKVMYCCSKCKMPASVLVKTKAKSDTKM